MKRILILAVTVIALSLSAVSAASAAPKVIVFTPHTFCVSGADVTSQTVFQDTVLNVEAFLTKTSGGVWVVPNGLPFISQNPTPFLISFFHLNFIQVMTGACPKAYVPAISNAIFAYGNGEPTSMKTFAADQYGWALENGYRIPFALPVAASANDGGSYFQDAGGNWYELIGYVPTGYQVAATGQYVTPNSNPFDGAQFAGVGGNYLRLVKQ